MDIELDKVNSRKTATASVVLQPSTSLRSVVAASVEVSQAGPTPSPGASETAAVDNANEQSATDTEQGGYEVPTMTKLELQLTFISLSVVGFLANLDTSVVATAMPTIASEFNYLSQQGWIILSYLLTLTVFQPLMGRACDLFGSRSVLFVSIFVFEFGSLLCALAKNFVWLCCARAIAGIGGAGIMIGVMVIVSQIVPLRERGNYMGIMYARIIIATVLGPLIGGLFVSFDWRWCFWINLVIAVPGLAILVLFAKKLPHIKKADVSWRDIDFGGIAILAVFVVSMCLAFNWGGVAFPWNSKIVIVLLVVGFALVPAFITWEIKVPSYPVIPMKMFRFRNVTTSTVNNFFTASVLQGVFIYLPSYYQIVRHDKQIISGLEVLPYIMPFFLTSIASGLIISKTGSVRGLLWLGGFFNIVGSGLLIMLNGRHPRAVEYILLILTGVAGGPIVQASLISAQSQVTKDLLATVTTMTMWSRSLGGIIGVAMQGSIINNIFKRGILENATAAPYVAQLLAVENVSTLPLDVQATAAQSYGAAFQMMMVATTVFCLPGFMFSLVAKKEKLS
ncbi:MFS general substrate transporter [Calocera cornea HHB12733]|uniref:MFS general substrate transporter n=1 Tax=Calocera cornea HHB12733 TaxID=1353952 RepID=A0A165K0E9_9BASI|nr:MFS general substrate transporter [Calocera cornea HHB12733]